MSEKRAIFTLRCSQSLSEMDKTNKRRIVTESAVAMDTVTVFGERIIRVEACAWAGESADKVAPDGTVKLKGCTTIEPGALMEFRPYRIGSQGSRYQVLFKTEHCDVMRTQGGVIIEKWRFRPSMTTADICEARARENVKIDAYYQSRREETVW